MDDDEQAGGQLEVFRLYEPSASLVSVGVIPDEDELWGSLGAWENPEAALIHQLHQWLDDKDKRPGAYRVVCTDRRGEMCTVDLIHGATRMGGQ